MTRLSEDPGWRRTVIHGEMTGLEQMIQKLREFEDGHPGATVQAALAHFGSEWEQTRSKLDELVREAAGLAHPEGLGHV